jgi:hypothetical protein
MEGAVAGANPDQAKMLGTPAQKSGNAVRAAVQASSDLQTSLRRQQANTSTTAAQQTSQQQAQDLSKVGDIQNRVPALIQQAQAAGEAKAGTGLETQLSLNEQDSTYLGLTPDNQAAFKSAMGTIGNKSATSDQVNQAMKQANAALGHTLANDYVSAADLQASFLKPDATVGSTLANSTPDTVTLGMLTPQDLGLPDWATLEKDLGLPAGSAGKMTVAQLGQALTTFKQAGYQTADQWRAVLGDPTSSTQSRDTARFMLKEMGAQGVKETEAKVAGLTQQVASANQVNVPGKGMMTVEQALSDDTLKGVAANYYAGSDGGALRASNPSLADWFDKEKGAMSGLVAGVDQRTKDYAAIQTQNQALSAVGPNLAVGDDAMKVLVKGWGTQSAVPLTAPPLLASLKTMDPTKASLVISSMSTLTNYGVVGEAAIQDLGAHSATQLSEKGLDTVAGMKTYTDRLRTDYTNAQAAAGAFLQDPEGYLTSMLGMSSKAAAPILAGMQKAHDVFDAPGMEGLSAIAPGGLLASGQTIASALSKAGKTTVDNFDANTPSIQDSLTQAAADTANFVVPAWEKPLYNIVSKGGDLTDKDVLAVGNSLTSITDLTKLRDISSKSGVNPAPVQHLIEVAVSNASNAAVATLAVPGLNTMADVDSRLTTTTYMNDPANVGDITDLLTRLSGAANAAGTDPQVKAALMKRVTAAQSVMAKNQADRQKAAAAVVSPTKHGDNPLNDIQDAVTSAGSTAGGYIASKGKATLKNMGL